jgi:hypothetical protein
MVHRLDPRRESDDASWAHAHRSRWDPSVGVPDDEDSRDHPSGFFRGIAIGAVVALPLWALVLGLCLTL